MSWFGRGPARAATPFKFFEERQASHDEHIVQRILRDKPSQLAIGLFVATFVHAILALREVTINGDSTSNVPGVAVVTAFTLVLVSIAVLVIYVHHIGQALRVSALIELVGDETRTRSCVAREGRSRRDRRSSGSFRRASA